MNKQSLQTLRSSLGVLFLMAVMALMIGFAGAKTAYADDLAAADAVLETQADRELVPMYRMFNPATGEHFYTASATERDYLQRDPKGRWNYEGAHWGVPKTSSKPVYRLCWPATGDHHYTMYASERDQCIRKGWRNEGIGWYSEEASKGVPLTRLFHGNMPVGAHHYTTNPDEVRQCVTKNGWREEGTAWYAVKPVSIQGARVSMDTVRIIMGVMYTPGKMTVTLNGKELERGTDYTAVIKYDAQTRQRSLVVTGMGLYCGTVTEPFDPEDYSY